jgi:hypothetical protein
MNNHPLRDIRWMKPEQKRPYTQHWHSLDRLGGIRNQISPTAAAEQELNNSITAQFAHQEISDNGE